MEEEILEKEVMVKLEHVEKYFGKNHVIRNVNMEIYKGEFLTILGSSGCGKTTLLRMIGGFEIPTSGEMSLEGVSVKDTPPFRRNVNTVFQSYALFPHMNVYDNIAYGLKAKKISRREIHEKVMNMLELVQLTGFEHRRINQLSGGQKQRIAIARSLVNEPKVLLLDEPLGALDLQLRKQMQIELKRLQKKLGITFVYVTHDQEEALTMSDRIAIMNGGVLEQLDEPKNIYNYPKTKFVADFIGENNMFEAHIGQEALEDTVMLSMESGKAIVKNDGKAKENSIVYVSVRPEKMNMTLEPVEEFSITGVIKENIFVGNTYKCIATLSNGQEVRMNTLEEDKIPAPGKVVYCSWNPEDAVMIHTKDNIVFDTVDNINFNEEKKVNLHEG